jgi:polysaccharide export outer membrane protein
MIVSNLFGNSRLHNSLREKVNFTMKKSLIALAGFMVVAAIAAAGQSAVIPAETGAGSTSGSAASPATVEGPKQANPRYQLRKGDSFEVDFAFSPELNQTVAVEPDGYATLKQVGSIPAEGKTVPELVETLKKAYAMILHDPVIAVSLKDFEKPYFIASGQVGKPGKYDLRGPLTVTGAVAIAGGFNDNAKHSQVVLFHPVANGMFEAKLLNVKQLLASRNLNKDIYVQPGDLVYVPQSAISKIRKFMPNTAVGAYYNPATY